MKSLRIFYSFGLLTTRRMRRKLTTVESFEELLVRVRLNEAELLHC